MDEREIYLFQQEDRDGFRVFVLTESTAIGIAAPDGVVWIQSAANWHIAMEEYSARHHAARQATQWEAFWARLRRRMYSR